MNFKEAFELMKQGKKMKLPSWGGYWTWDEEKQTIMMHCREKDSDTGKDVLDIRETQRVEYTISNMLSNEWEEATEENCTLLGGTPTFDFGTALKYMERGIFVRRLAFPEKTKMCIDKCGLGYIEYEDGKSVFALSSEDLNAKDWTFAE